MPKNKKRKVSDKRANMNYNKEYEEIFKNRSEILQKQTEACTKFLRQVVLAGIAIVWMFLVTPPGQFKDATQSVTNILLYIAILVFAVYLILEVVIYCISISKYRKSLKKLQETTKNNEPEEIKFKDIKISWILYSLKILIAFSGYCLLGAYIIKILINYS